MKSPQVPRLFTFALLALVVSTSILAEGITQQYTRTITDFRKTVVIDTVAKVLNYSDGERSDIGSEYSFWYAYDAKKCIYRKAGYKRTSNYNDYPGVFDVDENVKEIDLNSFDKSSVRYQSLQINHPSVLGEAPRITTQVTIFADGRTIFTADDVDPERIKRGWQVIYSKYCVGQRKEF